jgi:putative ABC transport system permease protein
MKYFFLVWTGLWRKPVRAVLTGLSIIVAFLLFGLVQGINQGMAFALDSLHIDRLYVMNRISGTQPLPFSAMNRIAGVPNIRGIAHWTYFGGYFGNARNQIPAIATNAREMFALYPELVVPPEQLRAMESTRTGAVIGRRLAQRFGWKVGDRVPLGTTLWAQKDGSTTWYFDVVGIFEPSATTPVYENAFFINYEYFDAARASGSGLVHMYVVAVADPAQATSVAKSIDALFEESSPRTRTRNEQAYGQIQMDQLGNIRFIANAVVGAALFTLLFVTANTMAQSIRERTSEFAVLKTLGLSDAMLAILTLCESLVLCIFAALAGLGLAALMFPSIGAMLGSLKMQPLTIVLGLATAALLALASSLVPALQVKRLKIVDALAVR